MTEVKNRLSTRNLMIILACIVLYFLTTAVPLPEGEGALTIQGLKAIALMVCAPIFWIWQRSASPLCPLGRCRHSYYDPLHLILT